MLASTDYDYAQCDRSVKLTDARPGQLGNQSGPRQVLVAIDGSGSMAAHSGGRTKMDEAREAVGEFLASLPADTLGGLAALVTQALTARRPRLRLVARRCI